MVVSGVLDRVNMRFVVALAAAMIACSDGDSVQAFDFFGLWGSDETPPPVSRTAISYAVTVDIEGGDGALKTAVTDASSLYTLRKDPPPDGDALARRARKRFRPDHRCHVGRRVLRRHRHDLDRPRQSEHPVQRHRGLCARRGKLPQPRGCAGIHQRQSGAALQSPLDPRDRRRSARSFRKRNCRRGSSASSPATPRRRPTCAPRRRGSSTISAKKGGRSRRSRRSPPSSITPPM